MAKGFIAAEADEVDAGLRIGLVAEAGHADLAAVGVHEARVEAVLHAHVEVPLIAEGITNLHARGRAVASEEPLVALGEIGIHRTAIARFPVEQRNELAGFDVEAVAHRHMHLDVCVADALHALRGTAGVHNGRVLAPDHRDLVADIELVAGLGLALDRQFGLVQRYRVMVAGPQIPVGNAVLRLAEVIEIGGGHKAADLRLREELERLVGELVLGQDAFLGGQRLNVLEPLFKVGILLFKFVQSRGILCPG